MSADRVEYTVHKYSYNYSNNLLLFIADAQLMLAANNIVTHVFVLCAHSNSSCSSLLFRSGSIEHDCAADVDVTSL